MKKAEQRRRFDRNNEQRRKLRRENPNYRPRERNDIPRNFHGNRAYWTDEMRQSYCDNQREFQRRWRARMTDEQRTELNRQHAQRQRERLARMTDEEKAELNRQRRQRRLERQDYRRLHLHGLSLGQNDDQPFNHPPETKDCGTFDQVCPY